MIWSAALTLGTLVVAASVAVTLAIYAWRHRGVPAARSFTFLMAAVAVMAAAYALQLGSRDVPTSTFWGNLEYLGIVSIPVGWLAFALEYTGRAHLLSRRNVALLALIPLITLALVWTNDAHGLLRRELRLEPAGALLVPAITRGPWFWVIAAYGYALMLAGTGLLVGSVLRGGRLARRQGGAALVAAVIPWVSNALYLAKATPLPYLDPTPYAFTVSGLIVAWDLFAFGLLDLVPVARDTVLAGMRDGVIVVDSRGRIVEINPAAERIVGRPAASLVGRHVAQVLPHWPAAITAPAPAEDGHVELRLEDDAGAGQRTYDVQITALRDRHRTVGGRLVVVRDVTERMRAEEERARLLSVQASQEQELVRREAEAAALRQIDRLKSDLLANVSHELRTPLTVVHAYAQRLAAPRPSDRERVEEFASRMLTSSGQLVRLVDELLDFDRLERGEVAVSPQPFDLAPLLAEVVEAFREKPGGHAVAPDWPAPLWVMADRGRVAQVVGNLLENALRYAGGRIVVRARLVEAPAAGDASHPGSVPPAPPVPPVTAVRVEVEDQGPGISADEQPQLWDRFYRGRRVMGLNVARGSGIGLAVVKSLVEAQRGRVGLESTPGLGSCFWFELPTATLSTVHP